MGQNLSRDARNLILQQIKSDMGEEFPIEIKDLKMNIDHELDSLSKEIKSVNETKVDTSSLFNNVVQTNIDEANRKAKLQNNAIAKFENEQKEDEDETFQARIKAAGGWDAIYDSLDKFQKGELQDFDTNFHIDDWRVRGNVLHNQESTTARPHSFNDKHTTDTWVPEFEGYLLNELNPVADAHYNRENPFLSIFGVDPSTANPGGMYSNPYKATHEYIKREMGKDSYDTLVAKAEQKFLSEKGFESMEEWNIYELEAKRASEIEGLKNYSYRDKKNVLLPLLEKMESEAKLVELKSNIINDSNKISPKDTTKAGALLQKTYEAQLDSIYNQSEALQNIPSVTSESLVNTYRDQGYAKAGVSPESFLSDQDLPY